MPSSSIRSDGDSRWRWLVVFASAAAAAVTFAPTLWFGFVWDDFRVVEESVPALTDVWTVFFPPHAAGDFRHYYRPVSYGLYWVAWHLGAGAPPPFHLLAVVLHALCAGLVGWLAFSVLVGARRRFAGALLAGVLFATHPIHVEAVAWIGSMTEATACVWLLASLCVYDAARRRGSLWLGGVAALLAFTAMLSKESALIVPFLALGLEWRPPAASAPRARRHGGAVAVRVLGMCAVLGIYIGLRRLALGGWLRAPISAAVQPASWHVAVEAVLYYVRALVAPLRSCHFIPSLPPASGWDLMAFATVLLAGGGVIVVAARRAPAVAYAVLWIGVTLLPLLALAVYPVSTAPVADRYAYLPSVGLAVLVGAGLALPGPWRAARTAAAVALVLVAAAVSWQRLPPFADDAAFWSATAACAPWHCLPATRLADEALQRGQSVEAERQYRRALTLECADDERGLALAHLGIALAQQGRCAAADEPLAAAARLTPQYAVVPYMLARCDVVRANQQIATGDDAAAREVLNRARTRLQQALALKPADPEFHYLYGQVAFNLADDATAREQLTIALRDDPNNPQAEQARALLARLAPP